LAAGAAGVSMLALAPPGEAEIIYTPAKVHIYPFNWYSLDLTGDGTTDFVLIATASDEGSFTTGYLAVRNSQTGNGVVATGNTEFPAAALQAGASIGPAANFFSGTGAWMAFGSRTNNRRVPAYNCTGPWSNVHNRYLGLRFMIAGEVHYGWARLNETCRWGYNTAVLTGYAYETVPDQGLEAGQRKEKKEEQGEESLNAPATLAPTNGQDTAPATLGTLAKGAPGLGMWRQEDQSPVIDGK